MKLLRITLLCLVNLNLSQQAGGKEILEKIHDEDIKSIMEEYTYCHEPPKTESLKPKLTQEPKIPDYELMVDHKLNQITVRLADLQETQNVQCSFKVDYLGGKLTRCGVSENNKICVAHVMGGKTSENPSPKLFVWNNKKKKFVTKISLACTMFALSPDGNALVTGHGYSPSYETLENLQVLSPKTGAQLTRDLSYDGSAQSLTFSENEKTLEVHSCLNPGELYTQFDLSAALKAHKALKKYFYPQEKKLLSLMIRSISKRKKILFELGSESHFSKDEYESVNCTPNKQAQYIKGRQNRELYVAFLGLKMPQDLKKLLEKQIILKKIGWHFWEYWNDEYLILK